MKKLFIVILLLAIFLITFLSRTIISFQTEEFSYEAYFSLRQIENINEHGIPLFEDSLSYGGRVHLFPPVFYYFISLFGFMGLGFVAKVIPNLLSSLIVIVIYFISFHITKNRSISLLSSFFSGFIPVFFLTMNDISVYSWVILLALLVIYFVMKIESGLIYLKMALLFTVIIVLSHASAFFLIIGLLIFLLLLKIESMNISKKETELILFASFLVLWFNFIIYKNAFLIHGPLVIWQNIPLQVLTNYFFDLKIIQSIYFVGIIPVIFGIYGVYNVLFKEKRRSLFLPLSMSLSIIVLLWFKLIEFKIGLMFLSLMLVILSSYSIHQVYLYFNKMKLKNAGNWFLIIIFLLFVLTAVIPSFNLAFSEINAVPSNEEIEALNWLKENTDNNSVVLGRLEEGYLINYYAHRKTVIDQDFLMIEDAQERYEDVQSIFSFRLMIESLRRLTKYDVDYIYFSGKFGEQEKIYYIDDECFEEVYNKSVSVYKVNCEVE
ncbi:MAG: hypothetical protein ABIB43_05355 [archaeon]